MTSIPRPDAKPIPAPPPIEQIMAEIEQIGRSFEPAFERAKNDIELFKGTASAAAVALWKAGFVAGCKSTTTKTTLIEPFV